MQIRNYADYMRLKQVASGELPEVEEPKMAAQELYEDIMMYLEQAVRIDPNRQQWVYYGQEPDDDKTLEQLIALLEEADWPSYQIKHNDYGTIMIIINLS